MRKSILGILVFLLIGVLVSGMAFAQEATEEPTEEATQDASMEATQEMSGSTGGMVTCSRDLVVMLYIAERYFGFGSMNQTMMDSGMGVDVSLIDKGQFSGLFDSMMMDTMMTDEQMSGMSETMMMDDSAVMQNLGDTGVMLSPTFVDDEPAECAALRTELDRFFTAVALQDLDGTMEATAEAGSMSGTVNFSTTLAGANEVPGPGDEDATGTAAVTVDFDNGQVCYNISVQNITLPAAAAHIHVGAAGESGGVVVPFDKAPDANGVAEGCVLVADSAVLNDIASNPAGFYVNVHTSDFPDGAVRGQVAG
jgi:hypothetical protein